MNAETNLPDPGEEVGWALFRDWLIEKWHQFLSLEFSQQLGIVGVIVAIVVVLWILKSAKG